MSAKKDDDRFKTHIRESRWQQAASIAIVAAIIIGWACFLAR